jgi:hypothetical protein
MINKRISETLQRLPKLPLDPDISSYIFDAIKIRKLASHEILDEVLKMQEKCNKQTSSAFRQHVTNMDIANIRTKIQKEKYGVDTTKSVESNLHEIFSGSTDKYKAELQSSCFLYRPKTDLRDKSRNRLKIGLCSPEQVVYAWKLAHRGFFMMDGTFGISKNKLLTFIIAGVDRHTGHGIPLAEFLFTPDPTHSRDSASYNSEILQEFLQAWKTFLEDKVRESSDPRLVEFKDQKFTPTVKHLRMNLAKT